MADAQPLYSTDVDQWLLENFPTAKGAKDAYDAFSAYLYGSDVDDHEDGAKSDSSDEEDRKAVELALTWHETSNPPPLLERYLGLGLRSPFANSEAAAAASDAIIPTHDTGSASSTADVGPPSSPTLLERMSCGNPSKPEWRSSSRTNQREEGSASSTADVPPSTATLLERMSCGRGHSSKVEWRSSSRTNQRGEFLRRTRGHAPSVLQELPTNRPSDRNPKGAKTGNNTRGGSRGPPPYRSDDSIRDHGPGRDLRYDQHRRGGGPERSDSTVRHMPPRRPYAAARKDTPQPPRRPTNVTAPSAPPPKLQPAEVSREAYPVLAAEDEQDVPTSQPEEAQRVQSPAIVPESYLRLATDPTSRGLLARIYKLVAIAYMYRVGSVRIQHVINALCVAYQATNPASQPEAAFNPPPEWHNAMIEAFLPKMLVNFAEEDTRNVANELLVTIPEIEKAIEERVQPPPLRKYLVVALILYIEHLIQFGAETIEQMKDWPTPLPRT